MCITVTSQWARWRLKSTPPRLFTQPFVRVQIKENMTARPVTSEFPTQRNSNAENISIWWRHHVSGIHVQLWLHYIPRNIHTVNMFGWGLVTTLRWRHNGRDSVSNQQPHDCLLNRLFRRISKKTSMLRVTGLCVGNSPGTGEFLAQMASNAENISIWWRHHEICPCSSGFLLS